MYHLKNKRRGVYSNKYGYMSCPSFLLEKRDLLHSDNFRTKKRFPMQIDGEPWMQAPCEIRIKAKNQVPVSVAPFPQKDLSNSILSRFGRQRSRRFESPVTNEENLFSP
uniref:Uncharacterized protein n=1 Tax=Romanomermis culicivorax TaxID=13658 RepID=A0A915JD03_ROMCU